MKIHFKISLILNMLIISMFFSAEAISQSDVRPDQTVLVQQGDSLFRIALENRPDQSVSIQQTMVAIQRLNPSSFLDGNINRVKAGERLLLPDIDQITRISLDDAIRQISIQNQQVRLPTTISLLDQENSVQLSVLAPEETPTSVPELGPLEQENAELDLRLAELENLVALNLEEEDRVRIRQEELALRLAELDAEINDINELIRLQDLQLAQLRSRLAEAEIQEPASVIPVSQSVPLDEENSQESQSMMRQFGSSLIGFFQSNSPLVTIAAPLALFLLGWLLWWDRAKYAESEVLAETSVVTEPLGTDIPEKSREVMELRYDHDRVPPERLQTVTSDHVDGRSNNQEESLSEEADDDEIEFIANPSDGDNFEDLAFLSEEERVRLDSPDAIEEIFYLGGDEESATKLELAYAYQKMGDFEGAEEILLEVSQEGNSEQKIEADELLSKIKSPNIQK